MRGAHIGRWSAVIAAGLVAAVFAVTGTGFPDDPYRGVSLELSGQSQRLPRQLRGTTGNGVRPGQPRPTLPSPRATSRRPSTVTRTAVASQPPRTPSPTARSTSATGTGAGTSGWKLTWADEFTGASGAGPSAQWWEYDLGGEPQWGNDEWQYYTDRADNVSLDGAGHLAISARRETLPGMAGCEVGSCDITSGRITTHGRFAQRYGRFEANIKIPRGAGVWPAFWMLGDDVDTVGWPASGEIDVMEAVGNDPLSVFGTAHATGFPDNGIGNDGYQLPSREALADGYHRYAVEWGPDRIDWFIDDHGYFTVRRSEIGTRWAFDHPFYLLLNLAVGGEWAGPPNASTFPATMLVDYVRVSTAS